MKRKNMTRRDFILKASVPFLVAACSKDDDEKLLPQDILDQDLIGGFGDSNSTNSNGVDSFVCSGALLQCNFGMAPSTLTVTDTNREERKGAPLANIMDNVPMKNIAPFGMCKSMSNPMVSAATAAAMGVLTPQPCIPVIASPWNPGGTTLIGNKPALTSNSKLMCNWCGQITINFSQSSSSEE